MHEQPSTTPQEATAKASRDSISPTGCCPPFEPASWDNQMVTWNGKPFVKERVHSLFHIPLDMRQKMKKGMRLIEASNAVAEPGLTLCDERSPWGADLYIEARHPIDGATMGFLSGTFLTSVYEGPYRRVPVWVAHMRQSVKDKGFSPGRIYVSYTTCPRCAKAYGKNYVVLFAEVEKAPAVSAQAGCW